MNDVLEVTQGLQCCLLCGRTLTNRALHDELEEPIINSIRLEHPEWASADGTCTGCVSAYREFLNGRLKRVEAVNAESEKEDWWMRVSRFLRRGDVPAAELSPQRLDQLEKAMSR